MNLADSPLPPGRDAWRQPDNRAGIAGSAVTNRNEVTS